MVKPGGRVPVPERRRRSRFGTLVLGLLLLEALPQVPAPSAGAGTPARGANTSVESCATGTPDPVTDAPSGHALEDLETRYRLKVQLRFSPAHLAVRELVSVCNRGSENVEVLHLSILARGYGEFRLRALRVDGSPVRAAFAHPTDLRVPLPGGLAPGASTSLEIDYRLAPRSDVSSSLRADLSRADGLLSVAGWFPIVSDGHGLRMPGDSQFTAAAERIRLELTLDRPLVVAAPGQRKGGRRLRHVFQMEGARDLAFLVAPDLRRVTLRTSDGVQVDAYARDRAAAAHMARLARRALETYSRNLGPYAWPRLVLVQGPRRISAREFPGLISVGTGWVEGLYRAEWRFLRRDRDPRWLGLDYVIAHEVAHQWFYALVGSDQLREPWLDEALAEFTAHHFFGPRHLLRTCAREPVGRTVRDFPDRLSDLGCRGYVEIVYRRGAVMVDGVRRLMGDEAFFAAMREYVADNRFDIASADDLVGTWLAHADDPVLLEAYVRWYLEGNANGHGPRLLEIEPTLREAARRLCAAVSGPC